MRIQLVISSLESGGAERVMCWLANQWVRQGHKVTLITFVHGTAQPFYPLDKQVKLVQISPFRQRPQFFPLKLLGLGVKLFRLRRLLKNPSDVVLSFMTKMNICVLLLSLGLRKNVCVAERIDLNFYGLNAVAKIFLFWMYRLAKRIVVQTRGIGQYFPASLFQKISIIPNVILPAPMSYTVRQKVSVISTVGRLVPQKDHPTLIRAFAQVLQRFPELELIIYGEGEDRKKIQYLIRSLGLEGKVRLLGRTKEVQSALLNSDLFVFPSRHEGFPNALSEALALGIPTIASNCLGNTDLVQHGDNGLLFPVGDVDALVHEITRLIQDRDLRKKLSHSAKESVKSYDEKTVMALWDELIKPF